ncbi:MAG: prolipoprotein diacylglyceryl transferase [Acidobacteria bacterium]|nr:prolipoprotein diacylglyceryl transferase [Acidobacteriota bacterium]
MNTFFDQWPTANVGRGHATRPAFQVFAGAGLAAGMTVFIGSVLLSGLSAAIACLVVLNCLAAFFTFAFLRQRITGRETHVLFEQLLLALAVSTGTLWLTGAPLGPYLDRFTAALAVLLSSGRLGCLSAGCCHGWPSRTGIVYREASGSRAVVRHLVGVRLFPVAALESVGLAILALVMLAALPVAAPGRIGLFFLAGYSILRYWVEGFRGDRRPHVFGLSRARWCSAAQFLAVIALSGPTPSSLISAALLGLLFGLGALANWRRHPVRHWLTAQHLNEIRTAARELCAFSTAGPPPLRTTSHGVSIGATLLPRSDAVHLSLSAAGCPLEDLCRLLAAAWSIRPDSVRFSTLGVLQCIVEPAATPNPTLWSNVYREAALSFERGVAPAARSAFA